MLFRSSLFPLFRLLWCLQKLNFESWLQRFYAYGISEIDDFNLPTGFRSVMLMIVCFKIEVDRVVTKKTV